MKTPEEKIILTGDEAMIRRELSKRTRRAFVVGAVASLGGLGAWQWLRTRAEVDGVPWPLRKTLQFNESLTARLVSPKRLVPEIPVTSIPRNGPRANGDIGLDTRIDSNAWRLRIRDRDVALTLDDLSQLTQLSQITPLNCIEGWTTAARWTGVRFADFVAHFAPDARGKKYVGLATPLGDYYVGIDMASAMHPQTMLCYAINNEPLSADHGAPLRLLIPIKYGIKNLKRIGEIFFSDTRPPDYWAEAGYDWFAGL